MTKDKQGLEKMRHRVKLCTQATLLVGLLVGLVSVMRLTWTISHTLTIEDLEEVDSSFQGPLKNFSSGSEGLVWFVQVSDIHMSIFHEYERISEFEKLCRWIVSDIKPAAVMATGDLTDAKTSDMLGSKQFPREWVYYRDALSRCNIRSSKTTWLDVRGNHDTFDLEHDEAEQNYFRTHGIQGERYPRSYYETIELNSIKYGLVAIDATLNPGPKRPFNFFGALTRQDMDYIASIMNRAKSETTFQIVFGHYPTSCILSPSPGIRAVIGNSTAYLCGHLHTLNNYVPNMYTRQHEGFLELELGDWKDNRFFRVLAVDQGHMAFADARYHSASNDSTVVVVTNPKDANFLISSDSLTSIQTSSHIRVLVFSTQKITSVTVVIDSSDTFACSQAASGQPLYVAKWDPKKYDDKTTHGLQVEVLLANNAKHVSEKSFSLHSPEVVSFTVGARMVLMSNWLAVTQAAFALCISGLVVPLCIMRLVHTLTVDGRFSRPRVGKNPNWLRRKVFVWLKRFWILANTDDLIYPLLSVSIYLCLGPWSIGYFLDNQIGILFPWGLYVMGTFLPADVTYLYGALFMVPYLYFFVIMAARSLERQLYGKQSRCVTFCDYMKRHLWFVAIMVSQALHCFEFYLSYGVLAALGVPGLLRLVFFYTLWSRMTSVKVEQMEHIFPVWPIDTK